LLNSNDFHFDTEIILQLLNANQRILELSIPTYYGQEISRVNGMKYARDVVLATLRNVAHRSGLLYQRRFDPVSPSEPGADHDLKLGYASSHTYALAAVPDGARVLNIGSDQYGVARELAQKGCGIAIVGPQSAEASDPRIVVFDQDVEAPPLFELKDYDYLLLLDVIEHLKDPERFLDELRSKLDWSRKTMVLTTPNIAFLIPRLMLLFGQFNYGKVGILARSHTRLFTFRSLRHLVTNAGFRINEIRGIPAPFPKALGNGRLGRWAVRANIALIGLSKTLFSYQIFVVAESTPDVEFVLRDAKERSEFHAQRAQRTHAADGSERGETRGLEERG
jgi:hypothetical protein